MSNCAYHFFRKQQLSFVVYCTLFYNMFEFSGNKMARFSQDELVNAFNKYMPKRPIYPPLVYDQESCDNSSTESEGSGDEEEDYRSVFFV